MAYEGSFLGGQSVGEKVKDDIYSGYTVEIEQRVRCVIVREHASNELDTCCDIT